MTLKKTLASIVLAGAMTFGLANKVDGEITSIKVSSDNAKPNFFSVSGDKVVWSDYREFYGPNNNYYRNYDIYMWDSVNGERPICTNIDFQGYPVISGNTVAWLDHRNVGDPLNFPVEFDVYKWDPINGETELTNNHSIGGLNENLLSICGDTILWESSGSSKGIWEYDSNNGVRRIASGGAPKMYGDNIVYHDNRDGNWDIFMFDSINGERQITNNSSNQVNPHIFGDTISWQDNRNGNGWEYYMWDSVNGERPTTMQWLNNNIPQLYGTSPFYQSSDGIYMITPEPSTLSLLAIGGLAGLGVYALRKKTELKHNCKL